MTHTLDGFEFDMPPSVSQIVALAQYHRVQLEEAIFRHEVHLGDFCLAQRKRVYDFTRQLDEAQRYEFYQTYNGELVRIADEDPAHPSDAENGVGVFAIFIALAIIAMVIYFAFVRGMFE